MKYRVRKALFVTTLVAALAAGTLFYDVRSPQNTAAQPLGRQAPPTGQGARAATAGALPESAKSTRTAAATAGAVTTAGAASTRTAAASGVNEAPASYSPAGGSFTGTREYAYYGYVQVQAVVRNGKILKVNVLEHPNDNGTSRYINGVAMPYLVQEAVQAQSAKVSLISGATLSSEAFVRSLSSALSAAGA